MQDVGGFSHLHHEGGLASSEIIHSANAGKNAISKANPGLLGWYPATDLSQQLDQSDLADITAFAAGIGPSEYH